MSMNNYLEVVGFNKNLFNLNIKVDCDEEIFEGKNVCDGADCGTWSCELIGEGICSVIIHLEKISVQVISVQALDSMTI